MPTFDPRDLLPKRDRNRLLREASGKKRKRHSHPEAEVQSAIMNYLRLKRIFCWRNNSSGIPMWGPDGRFKGMRPGTQAGVSDILGVLPGGKFLAIECKAPKSGRISEAQQEFIKSIREAGGIAFVAWGIREVELVINALNIPR